MSLAADADPDRPDQSRLAPHGPMPALFAVAVFTSAALVFLVEPLIGKLLLPSLGGSPAIWNTTLAFFQAALLAGYGYAHLLQRIGSVHRQILVHLGLLVAAAVVLPLRVSGAIGPPWPDAPAPWLMIVLVLTIGPPFALLSATAPLLQAWFARLRPAGQDDRPVYALYAASNLGSLLALAAYPSLVEPLLGLTTQRGLWSGAYLGFVLLLGALAVFTWRSTGRQAPVLAASPPIAWRERLIWLALAAAPSSLLMGVTSHVTSEVASVPFLWVVPLELYLLTFVVAFARRAEPPPRWLLLLQLAATPFALLSLDDPNGSWLQQLGLHLAAFLMAALACHLTLAARRPPADRLTEFYLWVALGGVVGGAFTAFLAPVIFDRVWEYPAVLILAVLAWPRRGGKLTVHHWGWLVAGLLSLLPLLLPGVTMKPYLRTALLLAPAVMAVLLSARPKLAIVLWIAMVAVSGYQGFGRYREHHRSFFGVVRLTDSSVTGLGPIRVMVHGITLHGAQWLNAIDRCVPTTYYTPATPIGTVFTTEGTARPQGMRMAVIGLGAGTVGAYVRARDSLRFFEIDPLVVRLAFDPGKFTFVKGCAKGKVDAVVGDARLSVTREPAGSYDLVLVDAFSSDSIPTHLLTVEALREYLRLIDDGGVVILHLSNRNLVLGPPAAAAVRAAGGHALFVEHYTEPGLSAYVQASGIILAMAKDPKVLDKYRSLPEWKAPPEGGRPWTDDYTNVWGAMLAGLKAGS